MQHHLVVQDCFNSILRLREARDDVSCAQDVHGLLSHAIKRMLVAPQALGLPAQDVQDIAFAIVALADEVAMRAGEQVAGLWQGQALQTLFFEVSGAGELFYERLSAVRQGPKREAVLLAYYTALALGFEGRLGDSAGRPEWAQLLMDLRRTLEGPRPRGAYDLSPNALADRTEGALKRRPLRAPTVALLALCAGLGVTFVGLQALLRARLQQVVELAQMRQAQVDLAQRSARATPVAQEEEAP